MNFSIRRCIGGVIAVACLLMSSEPAEAGRFRASGQAAAPGEYVVTMARPAGPAVRSRAATAAWLDVRTRALGGRLLQSYDSVLDGGVVALDEASARALAEDPEVAVVEPNLLFHAATAQAITDPALWSLDRIDQRQLPGDQVYAPLGDGAGTCIYVIDTGVRPDHTEFGGRASVIASLVPSEPPVDLNGHGTAMAAIAGGMTYGVAKAVTIKAVKVLNTSGGGVLSTILDGMQVAINDAAANPGVPCVMLLALSGPSSSAMTDAVEAAVAAGVQPVVAAGNSGTDACLSSPAQAPNAVTVGAVSNTDALASFSNRGSCVDLLAPGVDVRSAFSSYYVPQDASRVDSGTSQASAYVAGVGALLLADNPTASPSVIRDALVDFATPGVVTGLDDSTPNLLLYARADCRGVPQSGCLQARKSTVQLKDDATDDSKDLLKWSWRNGDEVLFDALGDPSSTTRYSLCAYDDQATTPSEAATLLVPPSAVWTAKGSTSHGYVDKTGSADGITKISLKAGASGKSSASVQAKGVNLPLPAPVGDGKFFSQDPVVTLQLQSSSGPCWSSSFSVDGTKKNSEKEFKASAQ